MANTATLTLKLDPEIKKSAEVVFGCFGLTLPQAINVFLYKALMEDGFPFEMRNPRFNAETEAAIQEAENIAAGRIQTKRYDNYADFVAEIEAELRTEALEERDAA